MLSKQFPENISEMTETRTSGRFFGAGTMISRLSTIIVLHTVAIFVGLWLFFSLPFHGSNGEDTRQPDFDLPAIASSLASEAAKLGGSDVTFRPDIAGAGIRRIFTKTAEKYSDIRRQVLFEFSGADNQKSQSILMEWENDPLSPIQTPPVKRELEVNLARSLEESKPQQVVKVTSDDRERSWRFVFVEGESDSRSYVYMVDMSEQNSLSGGWRSLSAYLSFFLFSILISFLIAYTLNRKISLPMERLRLGLAKIQKSAANFGEPVTIDSARSEYFDPIFQGFNELSSSFSFHQKKLVESREVMEQTLRESAEARFFLETMFETSPNAIVVTNLSGEILIFNYTGRAMFGYDDNALLPTQTKMLFKPEIEKDSIHSQQFSDIVKSERLCVRESGEVFPALVYVSTIKGPDGAAKGLLYVVNDISRSENFSKMIMRLDRISIRGEMASDIVHEINNYITVIQGNAELISLLIRKGGDTEKTEVRLNTIIENVKRISTFMSGMMTFEPNNIEFAREDLNQLIHNLIAFLKPQKRLHHVEIDLDLSPDIGLQELSAAMLQQLLVNLIYNSADALANAEPTGKGRIRIETMPKDSSSILLIVSDNGPGIPKEYLQALFEKGFSTKRKGHGIGLLTCAQIVKSHDGQIRYTGSTITGARFEIELPRIRSVSIPSALEQTSIESAKINS